MRKLKVKIIVGFRKDQHYTIDADEAHKAYYLFLNPDKRGIFSNGVAVIGSNIDGIEPDYIATMGWNTGYTLGPDDWTDIRSKGVDVELRNVLEYAKHVAISLPPAQMNIPLSEIKRLGNGNN
jgi:hypothetical protein